MRIDPVIPKQSAGPLLENLQLPPQKENIESSETQKNKYPNRLIKREHIEQIYNLGKSSLKPVARFALLGPLKWGTFALGVTAWSLLTTTGNEFLNRAAQHVLKIAPKPTNSGFSNNEIDGHKYDAFFANNKDFRNMLELVKSVDVPLDGLDSNDDGIRLNKNDEIKSFKERLVKAHIQTQKNPLYKDKQEDMARAIAKFNEIDILNKLLYGKDGLDPAKFYQGGIYNCQLLAATIGQTQTEGNAQNLKSMITITGYSFDKNNFYIDAKVHINGKDFEVPFSKLKAWMSPQDYTPSLATDGSLALPILISALQEAVEEYDRIPNIVSSSSPILMTGKDYLAINVSALDDDDLRRILSKAPEKLVTVGSGVDSIKELYDELIEGIKERTTDRTPTIISSEKERDFIKSLIQNFEESTKSGIVKDPIPDEKKRTDAGKRSIFFGSPSKDKNNPNLIENPIIRNHMFAVQSYKEIDGGEEIIVTDAHDTKYPPLNLKQFRENLDIITVHKDDLPLTNKRSLIAWILSILAIVSVRYGVNKTNRFLNPEYKSLTEKLVSKVGSYIPKSTPVPTTDATNKTS